MSDEIAVIGAGSWGTALAYLLAKKNYPVKLWTRRKEFASEIKEKKENEQYLPGVKLPNNLIVSDDLEETIKGINLLVLSIPAQSLRENLIKIKPLVNKNCIIVNTAKGIEENSLLRLSQVFEEVFEEDSSSRFAVLSGPSHAEEVGNNIPTAIVSAAKRRVTAEIVQDYFMTPEFRVYTNPDLVGVELAGALKNVIALGTGISDGLGYGDNTKAALITRGLAEISRLGVYLGAKPLTFSGLAGIGDLIVTCTSIHSRNRRAGIQIGKGMGVKEAMANVKMVVEGVTTAKAAWALANKNEVNMPITSVAHEVLFNGLDARVAVTHLMNRSKTHEMEEVAAHNYSDW